MERDVPLQVLREGHSLQLVRFYPCKHPRDDINGCNLIGDGVVKAIEGAHVEYSNAPLEIRFGVVAAE